ncbi:MAG: amidohydrolase [Oscillospiraceae bacterium]|nr:amidohydrolase [Oscillospiraceae bacterium]
MKTIYYNGRVYTGQLPLQQAFAVEGNLFLQVGDTEQLLGLAGEDDVRVDLGDHFVCAGFNDSHMHLLNYGQSLCGARLAGHTSSLSELLLFLKEYLLAHPVRGGQWVTGRGWNHDYFSDTDRMPDRRDLDAISTDVPIVITRACGHCCVVNSRALELAGIDSDMPDPPGGTIGRENGLPDGRLYENAMDILDGVLPVPDKETIKDMLRLGCAELNRYGVTSVQSDDYCVFPTVPFELVNEAYRELEESGELSVRVYEQSFFTTLDGLRHFVESGSITGTGSDMFRIGPLKMVGDGSLGSRTAHLSVPYADGNGSRGYSLFSDEHMNAMVSYAHAHGMQVAIHAIGDACLDQVLNAIELALKEHPRADHRHGVVHCQVSRPDQLERIRALHLHVYAQSVFLDYDNHIVNRLLPPALAQSSYSWKTLLESGVSVSNGSDCPVELPNVMEGIECAVTRQSLDGTGPYLPHEAFSVQEALDSYTIRGAEASFDENRKGRIREGYLADFVILGSDPFRCEPRQIHSIPVLASYLNGVCVYRMPDKGQQPR